MAKTFIPHVEQAAQGLRKGIRTTASKIESEGQRLIDQGATSKPAAGRRRPPRSTGNGMSKQVQQFERQTAMY